MSPSTRSPLLLAFQAFILCTVFLLITGPLTSVEAGKKEKLLLGLVVGNALSNRAREHSLIKLMIPLRMAAEAWKHFGHATAHEHHGHGGYEHYGHHGHEHYGGHHHHFDHLHLDEHLGHHAKA